MSYESSIIYCIEIATGCRISENRISECSEVWMQLWVVLAEYANITAKYLSYILW